MTRSLFSLVSWCDTNKQYENLSIQVAFESLGFWSDISSHLQSDTDGQQTASNPKILAAHLLLVQSYREVFVIHYVFPISSFRASANQQPIQSQLPDI